MGFQIRGYKLKRCLLGHLDPQIQGQNVLYAAEFISAFLSSSLMYETGKCECPAATPWERTSLLNTGFEWLMVAEQA